MGLFKQQSRAVQADVAHTIFAWPDLADIPTGHAYIEHFGLAVQHMIDVQIDAVQTGRVPGKICVPVGQAKEEGHVGFAKQQSAVTQVAVEQGVDNLLGFG